ncbi:hypothetical protein BDD12DRAFT_70376 [Trichophaea hybrida]|nr:hypothetical protein BDD12DRAFT_70376 [Trichophaea hybrida]
MITYRPRVWLACHASHRYSSSPIPPPISTSIATNLSILSTKKHHNPLINNITMGLFRRSNSCKDRYIRKCKDWIENPRPWMHKEFNIPQSCSNTCSTHHLIPILTLLLLGLATAYIYKFRKHPESFQKKKRLPFISHLIKSLMNLVFLKNRRWRTQSQKC